jgi:OOP family OmpA-OmpF porin
MASKIDKHYLIVGALLSTWLLIPPYAFARELGPDGEKLSGFYVGGGAGQAKVMQFSNTCGMIANAGGTVSDCDNRGTAFKGFGGYQFLRYFGVETGYVDFGRARAKVSTPGQGDVDFKTRAIFLEGVAKVPIINRLSFLAKGGVVRWNTKLNVAASTGLALASPSDSGVSGMYGAGFEYMFGNSFGIRAEYEIYENIGDDTTTGESHIHMISVSGLLRF